MKGSQEKLQGRFSTRLWRWIGLGLWVPRRVNYKSKGSGLCCAQHLWGTWCSQCNPCSVDRGRARKMGCGQLEKDLTSPRLFYLFIFLIRRRTWPVVYFTTLPLLVVWRRDLKRERSEAGDKLGVHSGNYSRKRWGSEQSSVAELYLKDSWGQISRIWCLWNQKEEESKGWLWDSSRRGPRDSDSVTWDGSQV